MVDLPRVLDGRAGMCNRVGLLCRGLGVTVNTCKQCQKWWSGGALTIGLIGGQEIVYFGGSGVCYTHLGCFGARGGAGGGRRAYIRYQN